MQGLQLSRALPLLPTGSSARTEAPPRAPLRQHRRSPHSSLLTMSSQVPVHGDERRRAEYRRRRRRVRDRLEEAAEHLPLQGRRHHVGQGDARPAAPKVDGHRHVRGRQRRRGGRLRLEQDLGQQGLRQLRRLGQRRCQLWLGRLDELRQGLGRREDDHRGRAPRQLLHLRGQRRHLQHRRRRQLRRGGPVPVGRPVDDHIQQ